MLWMNLSMSATQATDFGLRPSEPTESIETIAKQIEQLVPEFSPAEARRQAMLLRAGSNLICLPDLSKNFDALNQTNARRLFQPKRITRKAVTDGLRTAYGSRTLPCRCC